MKTTNIFIVFLIIGCVSFYFYSQGLKNRIANCQHMLYEASNNIINSNLHITNAQYHVLGGTLENIPLSTNINVALGQTECFKENEYVEQDRKNGGLDSANIPIINQL